MKIILDIPQDIYDVLRYMAIDSHMTIEEQAIYCLEAWDNFVTESYHYKDSLLCKKRPCNTYHHHLLEKK